MKNFLRKVMDYLFPNFTCQACDAELHRPTVPNLCNDCSAKLKPAKEIALPDNSPMDKMFAPFYYAEPVSNVIMRLKYSSDALAAKTVAPYMAEALGENKFDMLIPVPLSKSRKRDRGYNQSELLATEVSALTQIPVRTDILQRTRATTPQEQMTHEERRENQKDSVRVAEGYTYDVKGQRILLIDDVFTSGATLTECARVLRDAGAVAVSALVVARVKN